MHVTWLRPGSGDYRVETAMVGRLLLFVLLVGIDMRRVFANKKQ